LAEITRLRNSLEHLRASNRELDAFIGDPENANDIGGLGEVIKENEQVMSVNIRALSLVSQLGKLIKSVIS